MNCDTFGHPERLAAALGLLWHSLPALVASFAVTVAVVPVARAVAHRTGVVDQPDKVRKLHGRTVAYLGGVGLFVGVFAGIITNGLMAGGDLAALPPVPFSVVLGMIAITFTGLADDIWKFDARLKIAGQLVADMRAGAGLADRTPHPLERRLELQHIAGHDLAAEARPIDAGEECQLAAVFGQRQRCHGAGLRQRLDDQYARHDRIPGEVPGEVRFVVADQLACHGAAAGLELEDLVDQQKRRAVRDDRHDFVDRQQCGTPRGSPPLDAPANVAHSSTGGGVSQRRGWHTHRAGRVPRRR